MRHNILKVTTLALCLSLHHGAWAQNDPSSNPATSPRPQNASPPAGVPQFSPLGQYIDLDFPGGSPAEFIQAIRKAGGRINAVVPKDYEKVQLPPIKVQSVTVPHLMESLQLGTQRRSTFETVSEGASNRGGRTERKITTSSANVFMGFRTTGGPSTDSIWVFFVQEPVPPPVEAKICRYYQLETHLKNFSINDITTAIKTGWEMLGETNLPLISFHKETEMLIAVGQPSKLEVIDAALEQLAMTNPKKPSANANKVSVMGAVAKPGQFTIPNGEKWTLFDAVMAAGGPTEQGVAGRIEWTHEGETKKFNWKELKDKTKGVVLQPGDIVEAKVPMF